MSAIQNIQHVGSSSSLNKVNPAQDTTPKPRSRLESQKENDAKNALAHDMVRELAFKEQIKEQATHIINVLELEVAKMVKESETPSTQSEIIQNFSNYSSELLQKLSEATNPILTPDLKQDLEQWVQTGNTLVNAPIENQFDITNLEHMNQYIKQGLNFASKIGTEIFGTDPTLAEESLLNSHQLDSEENLHSHKNSNYNANYATISPLATNTSDGIYTSTGADINMFSILANVLASISQMTLNSVATQVGLNTNYTKFAADIQDLISVMTQISAAFKTAAANAALINDATNSLNIGFSSTTLTGGAATASVKDNAVSDGGSFHFLNSSFQATNILTNNETNYVNPNWEKDKNGDGYSFNQITTKTQTFISNDYFLGPKNSDTFVNTYSTPAVGNKNWNLAELLTMAQVKTRKDGEVEDQIANIKYTYTTEYWNTDSSGGAPGASPNAAQSATYTNNVIVAGNTATGAIDASKIYLGITTNTVPSAFIQQYAKTADEIYVSENSSKITMANTSSAKTVTPDRSPGRYSYTRDLENVFGMKLGTETTVITTTYNNGSTNPGTNRATIINTTGGVGNNATYFVNTTCIQNMLTALGAQAKAITGNDFTKSNPNWFKGGTQVDGLLSSLNTVLSTAQSQASAVVQQIGLLNQNNTTLMNNILSSFQTLTNALMKI